MQLSLIKNSLFCREWVSRVMARPCSAISQPFQLSFLWRTAWQKAWSWAWEQPWFSRSILGAKFLQTFSPMNWRCWDRYFKSTPYFCRHSVQWDFPLFIFGFIEMDADWRENNLQEVIQSVRSQLTKRGPPNTFSKNKILSVRIIFFWQFSLYTQERFPISQASCLTGKTGHTNRFLSFYFPQSWFLWSFMFI